MTISQTLPAGQAAGGSVELTPARAGCSVAVDARAIAGSGIGRYLRAILTVLVSDPRCARVTLLGNPRQLNDFLSRQRVSCSVTIVPLPGGFYSGRTQLSWLMLRLRRRVRADVWFFPHFDAPWFWLPEPSAVTVHDLTPFKVPAAFAPWRRWFGSWVFDRVASRATRIFVDSAATARDLTQRLPQTGPNVQTIVLGLSGEFALADAAGPATDVGRLRPFLLCVGNQKPHKNLGIAVAALADLKRDWPDLRLVIAGAAFAGAGRIRDLAAELGLGDSVVILGQVTDRHLRDLYAAAEVFLMPSLYEGFGMPVLEAMSCGTPVVASDRSALPEAVGDAGLLVDPTDAAAIAFAVRRLRDDPALRKDLVQRGLRRASEMTLDSAARKTVDALHALATDVEPG